MEITGTNGSDTLAGTAGDDVINGLGGFDSITGGAGDDVIDGGADGDFIEGGTGSDTIHGGDGADNLYDNGDGSDTLRGGAGADYIGVSHFNNFSATETVVVEAGADNDQVYYYNSAQGMVTIDLGGGADRLTLGSADRSAVTVTLGEGVDTVVVQRFAGFGTAPVFTDFAPGAGGDVLDLGDYLAGNLQNWDGSNPFGAGGYLRLVQSGEDAALRIDRDGTGGPQTFATLFTFRNADTASFSANNFNGYGPDGGPVQGETITGTAGADTLTGTVGDDIITGLGGFDTINGKAGNDTIDGGADGDSIEGGTGDDAVDGGEGNDSVRDTNSGSDTLRGGGGNDELSISHFNSGALVETISIEGGEGDDVVSFSSSARGIATIDLGDGADRLNLFQANQSAVTATLGNGRDTVSLQNFTTFTEAPVITDFTAGADGDVIDLDYYVANFLVGWDGANPFGSGGFLRLVQSGADTLLQADRDGAGATNFAFTNLLTFRNTAAAAFTAANFNGYAPDGAPVPGKEITGTAASETLTGTGGNDRISGLAGSDIIDGKAGSDVIDGGADNDTIQGGFGDDVIDGGDGNDALYDAGGSDTLRGGGGDDTIVISRFSGASGPTTTLGIEGGAGTDEVRYANYGLGTASIDLGQGADKLKLDAAVNNAVTATLGTGRDTVTLARFASFSSAPVLTDFATGADGDVVNLLDYLSGNLSGWDGTSNPFGTGGYLRLLQSGTSTLLQVDRDGASGFQAFTTLLSFANSTAAQFTAGNFDGYTPIAVNGADLATAFVTGPALVSEGDGAFRLSLTLKNASSVNTSVSMSFVAEQSSATGGTDVNVGSFSGFFSFTQSPASDYRIDLGSITIIDDTLIEGEETVAIRVTASGQVFDTGTDSTVVFVKLRSDDALINDVLGTEAGETLNGTDGADRILGLGGKDTLYGGGGDDWLSGGRGNDVLFGGAGADSFMFDPLARGEKDVVKDFGKSDRLLSTVKLADSNNDGVIGFGGDKALDIGGGEVRVYSEAGKLVTSLVYQGEFSEGDVTYYSYGLADG